MKKHQAGFTLVELVTVIIIIGILAVNVLPKFSGSSSFEAYSYRVQLISALRLTQQRAMQQTNSAKNYCHQIIFDDVLSRYGVPDRTNCNVIAFPSGWQPDASGLVVEDNHQVSFQVDGVTNPSRVRFNSMGQPLEDCAGGCVINVIGNDETVTIQIESEGYIHAR